MRGREIVIGQIGYGYWGPSIARCFDRLKGVRLKHICDSNPDSLREAGALHAGVELTPDVSRVIGDEEVEAVVVASPAATHFELARAALQSGKHVFVEKPMSLDVREGAELVSTAGDGRVLFVGHIFLYHPAVRFIRDYLASGRAGRVLYMYSSRLNLGRLRHDENCLWSLAPHDISIMLYLIEEEPESVIACGASFLRKGLEDVAFLTMFFSDGTIGNIHVSWLYPRKIRTMTVVGSERMLVFDDMSPDAKVKIFDKKVYPTPDGEIMGYGDEMRIHFGEEHTPDISMEEPLLAECRHFRDCVIAGEKPLTDGSQGLAVLRVLDAAKRSLESDGMRMRVRREQAIG